MSVTADMARSLLNYDKESGHFSWKKNGKKAGYAGTYVQIGINHKVYYGHRLAVLIVTGEWPEVEVDHINGKKTDNRWANLRLADRSENNQNLGNRSDNKSGYKGVWFNRANKNWSAQIQVKGKRFSLGNYKTAEEAYLAYLKGKAVQHTFQPTPREEVPA